MGNDLRFVHYDLRPAAPSRPRHVGASPATRPRTDYALPVLQVRVHPIAFLRVGLSAEPSRACALSRGAPVGLSRLGDQRPLSRAARQTRRAPPAPPAPPAYLCRADSGDWLLRAAPRHEVPFASCRPGCRGRRGSGGSTHDAERSPGSLLQVCVRPPQVRQGP